MLVLGLALLVLVGLSGPLTTTRVEAQSGENSRYAAIVAGCMNTIGSLGGSIAGLVTGFILNRAAQEKADALGISVETLARPGPCA